MSRHTKIVATLGPASSDLHTLERMAHAGVDVVRMNFSHGKAEEHIARADAIRDGDRDQHDVERVSNVNARLPGARVEEVERGLQGRQAGGSGAGGEMGG